MAHGFKYIPKRRTASQPEPQPPRCERCGARTDVGMFGHLCKEIIYGTSVSPTPFIPLLEDNPDNRQSTTACCPRETIPDSCSCLDGCECMCQDCDCGVLIPDVDW